MVTLYLKDFLEHAKRVYPEEACGFLYSTGPYCSDENWYIKILDNASENPDHSFTFYTKEVNKVRKWAKDRRFIKIGNIHTHPVTKNSFKNMPMLKYHLLPSKIDIKAAQKFSDVVRIIVCINKSKFLGIRLHDKFGKKIDTFLGLDSFE